MNCSLACARLLVSLSLLLALAPCQAQQKPPTTAPAPLNEADGYHFAFQYDPPRIPYIIVQVSINGKPPLPFMLDTGTDPGFIIDKEAAQRLGLLVKVSDESINQGRVPISRAADVMLVRFPSLAGGRDFHFKVRDTLIVDLASINSHHPHIKLAGIIGAGLLDRSTVQLDFSRKTLTLYLRPHPPISISGAEAITIVKRDKHQYFVPISPGQGLSANILLDTGSVETSLPQTVASQIQYTPRYGASTFMLGSYYISQTLLLPKIKVGDYSLDNFAVDTSPTLADCTLGIDFLSCFRVTLDFPRRQMFLERLANRPYRLEGWIGISLMQDAGIARVKAMEPGSPTKAAGLRADDKIISVDGHPLHGLSQEAVKNLGSGFAGTRATLLIQRGQSEPYLLSFVRASLFAAPPDIETGLTMEKPDKQPINVIQVDAGSPAQKSGLAAGDTIIAVEGVPARSMSADQTDEAFNKDKLTLTVRRMGEGKPRVLVLVK